MSDDVYMYGEGDIELNAGQPRETILVQNTGDRAVQVGSHFHFFEANRALKFERDKAFGKRLTSRRVPRSGSSPGTPRR